MTKVVISDKALREMVAEVLDNTGWSGEGHGPVVQNPITDPSVAVTDPVNPRFTPQNKTEFGVAMGQLVKNLPDTEMPSIYSAVKKALDQRSEKDEMDAAQQQALLGGSQEAIDANMGKGKETKHKQEGKMSDTKTIEEQLRAKIRGILLEVLKEAGELPPVKKIPFGQHGGEYLRRQEKTTADLRKNLGHAVDRMETEPEPSDEEEPGEEAAGEEGGEEAPAAAAPAAPTKRAYKPTAIGGVSDVQGKSFEDIAKELGFSVAGAKQAVDKAMTRYGYMYKMPEYEREIMVLTALNNYIDMLNKTGELAPADVQFMKDHPDHVRELDGFREFFHNTIRRAMKGGAKLYDPIGPRGGDGDEPHMPDEDEDEAGEVADALSGEAPAAPETPAPRPTPKAGKTTYKVYGKLKGAPAHTRVKGKAFLAPADTQFKSGDSAVLEPTDGHMKVKKTDSDHTQEWMPEPGEEAHEGVEEADVPGQIKGKSVADPKKGAAAPRPGDKSAAMASGKKASVDWGGFDEGKGLAGHLLAEARAMIMQDSKGPYVIADGVEARPANPNHTQYRPGTKVNVHRHGKKGTFIVEMPNGEKWTNKPMKG